jgi:MarR family transcriptional regulator, organic hydroperoxide resistance regulator
MQQLENETNELILISDCSARLLEVTPLIMHLIRVEMHRRTMPGLSIPQFRTLNYLSRHPHVSLNILAEHLGLTPATTSKLVQKLVTDKVVSRREANDRRRVCLTLTQSGIAALNTARSETRQQLADGLKSLSKEELAALSIALRALGKAFSQKNKDVNVS